MACILTGDSVRMNCVVCSWLLRCHLYISVSWDSVWQTHKMRDRSPFLFSSIAHCFLKSAPLLPITAFLPAYLPAFSVLQAAGSFQEPEKQKDVNQLYQNKSSFNVHSWATCWRQQTGSPYFSCQKLCVICSGNRAAFLSVRVLGLETIASRIYPASLSGKSLAT